MKADIRRITVQVTPELYDRIQSVPHGFRSHLMARLITLALDAIDRDGEMMLGALMAGKYKLVPDYEKAA